jgi:DNA-binding XRE family transcriptional regulator
MTNERQIIAFRAIRAALGLDQRQVAIGSGISERTYIEAEKGRRCSSTTERDVMAYYASKGARLVELPCGIAIHIEIRSSASE